MPAKQRVRRHDGRDVPQPSATQPIRPHGESAPIIITQPQPLTTQLPAKHTILFEQIPKDVSFLAVQPAGQKREQQLEPEMSITPRVYITATNGRASPSI